MHTTFFPSALESFLVIPSLLSKSPELVFLNQISTHLLLQVLLPGSSKAHLIPAGQRIPVSSTALPRASEYYCSGPKPCYSAPLQLLPSLSQKLWHKVRVWKSQRKGVSAVNELPVYQGDKVLVVQSCPTLFDPLDCSLQGCSVHGIFQTSILE